MGLLDSILSSATGGTGLNHPGLLDAVTSLIHNPDTGGLAGLVENFRQKGLGDAVASWISTGHYEKSPVMASWRLTDTHTASYMACPRADPPFHNYSVFRNLSSESDAWNRWLAVFGSCSFASAFSFIARLASTY